MHGRVLAGRYEIGEELGHGGMSVVYRATDRTLGRTVAIKILHPHLARKETSRLRFAREAKAVARLSHPNIVEIYDYSGADTTDAFIVTELVEGQTLDAFIEKHGPVLTEIGVVITAQVAAAVAHAHDMGVIHRDLKPENVMIGRDGALKLMDFGIARLKEEVAATSTGLRMGTPHYMSPEQASGSKEIDERADVFSLGILLYWLCTGALPFPGDNPAVVLKAIIEGAYEDPSNKSPCVGRSLARAIREALAQDPRVRPASAGVFRAQLDRVMEEAAITEPAITLRHFFSNPQAFTASERTRLIALYQDMGTTALAADELPRALDFFNRVLSLDPGNEAVVGQLARIQARPKRQKLAWAVIPALLAGASATTWYFVEPSQTPESETSAQLPQIEMVEAATPNPPPPSPAPKQHSASPSPRALGASPRPTARKGASGFLRLRSREQANVFIDGVPRGNTFELRDQALELSVGDHRIELRNEICQPRVEDVRIDANRTLERALYLPGCETFLWVEGPAGAQVLLDGKTVATLPLTSPVRTLSGSQGLRVQTAQGVLVDRSVEIPTHRKDQPYRFVVPGSSDSSNTNE